MSSSVVHTSATNFGTVTSFGISADTAGTTGAGVTVFFEAIEGVAEGCFETIEGVVGFDSVGVACDGCVTCLEALYDQYVLASSCALFLSHDARTFFTSAA